MLIRQLYDQETFSFSYFLADLQAKTAMIIDPVKERLPLYLQLLEEFELNLHYAIDTHLHADHITGMGALREATSCKTLVGQSSKMDCADEQFADNDMIHCGNIALRALYTPGHTNDSYSFYIEGKQEHPSYVFTGDTLFIRGTGRTDFMGGSSEALYHSLFDRLLMLPDSTIVYPGHDYKGMNQSTIGEEKQYNPRLQVNSWQELAAIMDGLNLAKPEKFTTAINANTKCGELVMDQLLETNSV
jgi:glyoxylase-like metal-dependent hydrolase (beta-lactamase superfamily II)